MSLDDVAHDRQPETRGAGLTAVLVLHEAFEDPLERMVRNAGASEVHVLISSPPTSYPCYYGIDTPTRKELISSSHTIDEINRYITADSLGYLSREGLISAVGGNDSSYCRACFTGRYPIAFPILKPEPQLDLFEKE